MLVLSMENYIKHWFCEEIPNCQLFPGHFSQASKTKSLS